MQNFRLPGDVSASKRYWAEDIIEPGVEVSPQGTITVSDEPGTGYRIREDLIEKLAVRKETFVAV
jgi:O-succinylbenzoate synthase